MSFLLNPYVSGAGGGVEADFTATFDGTNDYLSKTGGLTGASDGTGFACVFYLNAAVTESCTLLNIGDKIEINKNGSTLSIKAYNSSSTEILSASKTGFFLTGAYWYMISWEQGGSFIANRNGSLISITPSPNTADNIDIANSGTIKVGDGSVGLLAGDLYNFWADDRFLDFTDSTVIAKFKDGSNKAVNLGSGGQTPTGTSPLIYLNGYGNFENNGRSGAFVTNGALTQGGAAPL